MSRRWQHPLLLVSLLVLLGAFWLTIWQGMDRSVLSQVPILDEAHYLHRAVEIRAQGWLPQDPFTMSPLYSYLVAVTGSGRLCDENQVRTGEPPRGIRWLQALLWCGTAFLLWRVGRDLFGAHWGWGPPLLWLGYAPAVVLAGQVLMEIPLVFAATLALAVSGGHVGPVSRLGRAALAGALVGAALLLRGTAVVLLVPVLLALLPGSGWRVRLRDRDSWLTVATVVVALLIVTVPFAALNSVRAGRLAPPALNGGVNLYIGNGPGADGFYRAFPGFDVEDDPSGATYLGQKLGQTIPDALTADRVWAAEARQFMAAHPWRTIGLWARKVWLHFVGVEIPQISAFSAWARYVPLLRGLLVPWALLAIGGLAGGVLGWRAVPALRPWLLAVGLLVAVQSLFFVVTRYRIILAPALALATVALVRELVSRRGRNLLVGGTVLLVAALVIWPWGLSGSRRLLQASSWDNEAVRWEHLAAAVAGADMATAGEYLTEAESLYRQSLAVAGDQSDAWRGQARVLWSRGQRNRAIKVLVEGLGQVAETRDMRRDLIGMLMLQKRSVEAVPQLELALAREPNDAGLLENMVIAQTNLDQPAQALVAARRLVAVRPDDPRAYLTLGSLLGRAGHLSEAEAVFAAGLERLPGSAGLLQNLDHVRELLAAGRN